jgi:hypothetical protein
VSLSAVYYAVKRETKTMTLTLEIPKIYGVVTSGTSWMFGFLEEKNVLIDLQEYGIDEPERILGVLAAMVH